MVFLLAAACGAEAEADLAVYGDSFLNEFRTEYSVWVNPTNTSPVHSGIYSISVSPTDNWQGVSVRHPGFDTTPYSSLSFWVHGGADGRQRLQVQGLLGIANPLANVYYRFTAPTGAWQQVTIPLASLGIAQQTNCTGFWIQLTPHGSSNIFYVDDVQFNAESGGATAPVGTNISAPASPVRAAGADWSAAAWCIVGVLTIITILLAWLILMLRRSGLGTSRALIPMTVASVPQIGLGADGLPCVIPGAPPPALEAFSDAQAQRFREKVALELAEFAKQSLIQGLYSQRSQLIETQQQAQEELAALEARLAMLQLPLQERIRAYELRITELEKQLETRDQEMRDMIQATLLLVQERLEKEKGKENVTSRLN